MGYSLKRKGQCSMCGGPVCARHLCRKHYNQERNAGRLDQHALNGPNEAFDIRVQKTPDCWVWTGTKNDCGYGIFLLPGEVPVRAHRYAWERENGPIPKDMVIRHKCDNPACVNPSHLLLGTKDDNNKDTAERHRHNYGLSHWNGKLSDQDVLDIRSSQDPQSVLAKRYGVNQSHISYIKAGRQRRYLATIDG